MDLYTYSYGILSKTSRQRNESITPGKVELWDKIINLEVAKEDVGLVRECLHS